MGLLEDAIREHLDLKRKHGAEQDELERQEVEALGPVRREVSAGQPDADEAPQELPVDDAEPVLASDPPLEPDVELDLPPETSEEPDLPLELDVSAELLAEDLPADLEPDPRASPTVNQPTEHFEPVGMLSGDTPPRGFPVQDDAVPSGAVIEDDGFDDQDLAEQEDLAEEQQDAEHREDDDEPADADVLEDTPDFLQDAPEHDKLWFEQKPPRDFDFD
jgi:hypothetical protein